MARDIKNKIVVVTGGAQGIGFEIANNFLKNGASRVIILDINEDIGKESVANLTKTYGEKIDFFKCDVTKDLETVSQAIFDKYKKVDILVNNAGIVNEFDAKKTMEVNVIALIQWSYKFLGHMSTEKGGIGGTILNIASIYGFYADPFIPVYQASKHAVMGFTKSLGHEYNFNRFGVRVVAICPGFTDTKNLGVELPDKKTKEDFVKFVKNPATLWQKADAVGKAAVEVIKIADSGTAWVIEGGNPIARVPIVKHVTRLEEMKI